MKKVCTHGSSSEHVRTYVVKITELVYRSILGERKVHVQACSRGTGPIPFVGNRYTTVNQPIEIIPTH